MATAQQTQRDFEIVKRRILKPLLTQVDTRAVGNHIQALRRNGSWPDIDYKDMSTVQWKPIQHLSRLFLMAQAFRSPKSDLANDPQLKKAIASALNYWLKHDFIRPWWYQVIGTPGVMSQILLLIEEDLTEAQFAKGIEILERATLSATGQNLVWLSSIVVRRALLQKDAALVRKAYRYITREIKISTGEGIQPDFSFHQHGVCLYNHGYGAGFASDCARTAVLVTGTQFAFPQDKIDILSHYILDGSQWLSRGSTPDHGAVGRQITRPRQSVRYLSEAARNMLKLPTGRDEEFRGLVKRAANKSAPPLEGNRHFWRSDIMAHHRKAFYTSARMFSTRTFNTDGLSGCEEGLMSHHLADGANYLYLKGDEYLDIFPVWDWQKVPGTTVALGPQQRSEPRRRGTTDFVGGVSDGTYGLAASDFERDGLTARKVWIFFDTEYVCLGAGIAGTGDPSVVTTLNQCHHKGAITVAQNAKRKRLGPGEHALDNPTWIHHNRVAYQFLEPGPVCVSNHVQKGNWKRISNQSSDTEIAHDVFTAWIDHGPNPENATYACVVHPNVSVTEAAARAVKPDVQILQNDSDLQAVRHKRKRITGIAFYKPSQIALTRNLTLGADKPCLVLVRETPSGLSVSLSNPKNRKLTVNVTLQRKNQNPIQMAFDLPGGMYAGQTATQTVKP